MPKRIDHDERATLITEAAWRVLVDRGVAAVSVRNVAQEAGVATASLRRAFPAQSDLLIACLTLMGRRVAARVDRLPQHQDPVEHALAVLAETLPLDDERRVEMEVYLALGTAALSDMALGEAFAQMSDDLDRLAALVLDGVAPRLTPVARRRARLHLGALVDGLALRVLHGADGQMARTVLREHLTAAAGGGPR